MTVTITKNAILVDETADLEAAALNLTRGRRNELEAAFHRARKS